MFKTGLTFHRAAIALLLSSTGLNAAQLPEDRADVMYHFYDGGGVEIDGPSILARKQFGNSTSVSANYYVDMVTSASIDVVTTASPYVEERTEKSLGVDYINGKTTLAASYTNSEESDFAANSAHFSISQDFFGDLSTLTMGYSRGWDDVGKSTDADFTESANRQHYRLGLSQIVSKNLIVTGNLETISDEGFLNSPYRQVRYLSSEPRGYSFEDERYPNTRTSTAISFQSMYYLQHRAALRNLYRYFSDDWDITAHTLELEYIHPVAEGWVYDVRYRYYQQNKAEFYSDLFASENAQNFLARDKELSAFTSHTIGFGLSYDLLREGWKSIDRGSINFYFDYVFFDYDDFRDIRGSVDSANPGLAGNEPLYSFEAIIFRVFYSIWY